MPLISDNQSLVSATGRFGHSIRIYDDGYGPLFIHRDSMGVSGIVRAQTWEDAYSICEDEFFPSCDLTEEELVKEYGFKREHVKIVQAPGTGQLRPAQDSDYVNGCLPVGTFVRWETRETLDPEAWPENELFQEAYGFRPSGKGGPTPNKDSGIYAKDLNGDSLELLTPSILKDLEITLAIETEV